jgi:hypothetical protein
MVVVGAVPLAVPAMNTKRATYSAMRSTAS